MLQVEGVKYCFPVDCSPFQHISGYCLLGTMFGNPFFSFQMMMPIEIKYLGCVWDVFETILE